MCGRYTRRSPLANVVDMFSPLTPRIDPELWAARFNIAPSQDISVIRLDRNGDRTLTDVRWGLVPHWASDASIGNRMINARAETAASKPAFRQAFDRRRCLIVADGFYEWKKLGPRAKQPMFIHMKDDRPFAFAGLWERWRESPDAQPLDTCTILTTTPNALMAPIHDRMPAIVDPKDYDRWLDPAVPGQDVKDIPAPYAGDDLEAIEVTKAVNSPANEGPECIESMTKEG